MSFQNCSHKKGKKLEITNKDGVKITQQKGKLFPIQLQKTIDAEIKRFLTEGHIEKIDLIKDDVAINQM